MTSSDVRERLVEDLRLDLVGTGAGHIFSGERLPGSTRRIESVGLVCLGPESN